MLETIHVEITKTADGLNDYIQIRSPAAIPVNIVLVAQSITVTDHRRPGAMPIAMRNRLVSDKDKKRS